MPDRAMTAARAWVRQAQEDLKTAENLMVLGIHYAACLFAQQAGEKALKAALLALGLFPDRTQSVVALALDLEKLRPEHAGLSSRVGFLDQYYVPTRYPDALPGGIPADLYGLADGERAVAGARLALDLATKLLEEIPGRA